MNYRRLQGWLLRAVGTVALFAFAAVVLPRAWMEQSHAVVLDREQRRIVSVDRGIALGVTVERKPERIDSIGSEDRVTLSLPNPEPFTKKPSLQAVRQPLQCLDTRRGDRVADCAGLENRCGRKSTEGSNPSLSAVTT